MQATESGMTARLVTARELAEAIGLKPATVLDKWERGEFPGYRFGRAVRFDLGEILELGRQGAESTRQPPKRVL
jgi:predicted DNA-binding transcriptional regulator AlpA